MRNNIKFRNKLCRAARGNTKTRTTSRIPPSLNKHSTKQDFMWNNLSHTDEPQGARFSPAAKPAALISFRVANPDDFGAARNNNELKLLFFAFSVPPLNDDDDDNLFITFLTRGPFPQNLWHLTYYFLATLPLPRQGFPLVPRRVPLVPTFSRPIWPLLGDPSYPSKSCSPRLKNFSCRVLSITR